MANAKTTTDTTAFVQRFKQKTKDFAQLSDEDVEAALSEAEIEQLGAEASLHGKTYGSDMTKQQKDDVLQSLRDVYVHIKRARAMRAARAGS